MRSIKIRDIKHIKSLDFKIPSKAGVYVLTGSNGSGKTTLLACLLRIGRYRAFQDYFKIGSGRLDQFRGSITYSIEGKSVSYQYTGERWPPRPRKNSAILSQFGFPNIRFLPATGNRLFIHGDNIQPSDFKPVKQALKDNMEHLLESSKFQNLRFVQTGSI
ncbi:MAG TPA: AAA family ATPase, partial [Flavobacteriaceae bacterium]|nr:AAA family ATPase [Flavobacteriaceae bacterium]